ncbi:MAG: hypothetical protein N2645_19080 [Clostridia bacterium]|nr:hypothetical protein [Clostridia bacterium]
MTIQIDDKVDYLNTEYSLIRIENGSLFEPSDYGFSPVVLSSACWRGHYCKYIIENGSLILSQLSIGLETDNPPVWRSVKASGGGNFDYWKYEGVRLPIGYTGGIIIGNNLLQEFYDFFGFHNKPHCYKHVIELIFKNGEHVNTVVYDEYMDKARTLIRLSIQKYKKLIGYYENSQTVTIKLPEGIDIKNFTLLLKELASKYISATSIDLFNKFRSKGFIELDKKLHFYEYRELSSKFEKKGYKNMVATEYSTDSNTHLDSDDVINQYPDFGELLELYNKYGVGKIHLL